MTRKGAVQRLATMKQTRERDAAIREVWPLSAAMDRAWGALGATQKVCKCCGQSYYPKDTPEWQEWDRAYHARNDAIGERVATGRIPPGIAILKFNLVDAEVNYAVDKYRRAQSLSPEGTS